jgi:lysylphosphatidylglycerol synthetase-like protein (DUF2156 family)
VRALDRPRYDLLTKRIIEKVRLRALREYGNFALAYSATFQPGLDYFGSEEGFLAYKQVGSTAFVLSNPLAPIGGWEDLIRSFVSEMGAETRMELGAHDFEGPRKRNFRRALNRTASARGEEAPCADGVIGKRG